VNRTVDVVIVGCHSPAALAAVDAARRGLRVLVVIGARRRTCSRLCQALRRSGVRDRVIIMTGAEVVCVGGVAAVEAVVIRRKSTGRLVAFNTSGITTGEIP
jgi:hypothetical protein